MSTFKILVDGAAVEATGDTSVAAALVNAGIWRFRASIGGEPRGPICAMGICFECRITLNGQPHRRACLEPCRPGLEVVTGDG